MEKLLQIDIALYIRKSRYIVTILSNTIIINLPTTTESRNNIYIILQNLFKPAPSMILIKLTKSEMMYMSEWCN